MSRVRTTTLRAALLVAPLLLAATACESVRYGHVQLRERRSSPNSDVSARGIIVPEGGVVVFEAQPRAELASREYEGLERFKLRPVDLDVAHARRAILRDTWALNGVAIGMTALEVIIDGVVVDEIPVEVIPMTEEDGR